MKTHTLAGERIAKNAQLQVGCAVVIFDDAREKVLLTQRTDNGQWCLPSGRMDPGESVSEAAVRETLEETGLEIDLIRLTGVYSTPHLILVYPGDTRVQTVSFTFEGKVTGGALGLSSETTAFGYFDREEMTQLDIIEHHIERIADAFKFADTPFIK